MNMVRRSLLGVALLVGCATAPSIDETVEKVEQQEMVYTGHDIINNYYRFADYAFARADRKAKNKPQPMWTYVNELIRDPKYAACTFGTFNDEGRKNPSSCLELPTDILIHSRPYLTVSAFSRCDADVVERICGEQRVYDCEIPLDMDIPPCLNPSGNEYMQELFDINDEMENHPRD